MTKATTNTPAFSAKAAAAAWVKGNAAAKKSIRNRVADTASKSPRKRWAALLKDIDAADVARVKARATGDWSAVNKARDAAKPKPAPKPKAAKPTKAKPVADDKSVVAAAKAFGALVAAGEGASPEALALVELISAA